MKKLVKAINLKSICKYVKKTYLQLLDFRIPFLEFLIGFSISFLAVLSLIAFGLSHLELFDSSKYVFSWSSKGFENYINELSKFENLFAATIPLMTLYLAYYSLKISIEANHLEKKANRFAFWKEELHHKIKRVDWEKENYMQSCFSQNSYVYFSDLYKLNFIIKNKKELKELFDLFKNDALRFEAAYNRYKRISEYSPKKPSNRYSFIDFSYLFSTGINTKKCYKNYLQDLEELYAESIPLEKPFGETGIITLKL